MVHSIYHKMHLAQDDARQEEEEREVSEVEMLLGSYYMILDSTWNKLTDISEFVDDAEVSHADPHHKITVVCFLGAALQSTLRLT